MELAQIWTDRGMLNFLSTFGQIKKKKLKQKNTHKKNEERGTENAK